MKKIVLFIALCSILASCSNDSDVYSDGIDQNQACDVYSFDDVFRQDAKRFSGWNSSSQGTSGVETRSSVTTITLKGYTSKKYDKKDKYVLSKELASLMGIPRRIYIAENVTAYQTVIIKGLGSTAFFTSIDSPLCGLDPNGTNYKRGYVSSTPVGDTITLSTKFFHVISDLSGISYDRWYPCKPEEVQWNYNLVNL